MDAFRPARRVAAPCLAVFGLLGLGLVRAEAQMVDDAVMMPNGVLCTGFVYTHDSWGRYWEGTQKRDNGNIGTLTTHTVAWMGTYGLGDRVNLIATLPWMATEASQGTLKGMSGLQDLSLAAKARLLDEQLTRHGRLSLFAAGAFVLPVGDYTPDFYPMSIGTASRRAAARALVDFQAERGWFVGGTVAYTFRGKVTLDRDAYFTDDRLYLTNQVALPDVIDYTVRVGYYKHGLYAPIAFTRQITLGGGDIRRQDMPFVSNRMNFSRLDALALYYLSRPQNLVLRAGASYTLRGRNVGQSTTFTAGVFYTFHF